jgi:hypothetical protein
VAGNALTTKRTLKPARANDSRSNKKRKHYLVDIGAAPCAIAFYVVLKTPHSPRRYEGDGFAVVISNKLKKNFCIEKRKASPLPLMFSG